MEKEYNNYMPPFMDYSMMTGFNGDNSDMYKEQIFNPIIQYEQAYSYYKYLSMQMDYKIKCKQYEEMCNKPLNRNNNIRETKQ